jgi:hypothetical protein
MAYLRLFDSLVALNGYFIPYVFKEGNRATASSLSG